MVDGPNENVNVNENNNDVNVNQNDNNNQIDNQQNDNRPQLDNFLGDIEEAGLRARRNAENLNFINNILNNRVNNPIEDIIEEDVNEDDNDNDDNNEQNEQNLDVQNNEIIQPQQQPQPIARRPVTDLFGNGDDDDEAEFDPFAAHENPQVVLQMPVVNAEHQNEPQNEVVENNPQQNNPPQENPRQENPPRELTEEERQRRAADDARMAQIAENFRKNMADIDAEEAAEKKARK